MIYLRWCDDGHQCSRHIVFYVFCGHWKPFMTCQKRRKIKKIKNEHIGGGKREEKKNDDSRKTVDFVQVQVTGTQPN